MDSAHSQYELINDAAIVRKFMHRLHDHHALLSVRVGNHRDLFNSVILDVDEDGEWIEIDELHPEEGHKLFLAEKTIHVTSEFDGIDLVFDSELLDATTKSNIYVYTVAIPKKLKYFQRRSTFRVRMLRSAAIAVFIRLPDGASIQGELYNLSSGGVGIKFPKTVPRSVSRGVLIPECELRLTRDERVVCALETRHVIPDRSGASTLLGGRFVHLTPTQQRMINRFIATVEREQRRKAT